MAAIRRALRLNYSTDSGETWSDPKRVDASSGTGSAHVRTPMLAVNGQCIVGMAWYDRRHDPKRECQQLYFAASVDGGETFLVPLRLSTEASCPQAPENGVAAQRWPMGGDYSSIAASPDHAFHIVWADSRSRRFRLRSAAVRVVTR